MTVGVVTTQSFMQGILGWSWLSTISLYELVDRSNALQRRLNEREKEMEADERDRQKEREELEEIRKKLLDDGHPDPEAEMERVKLINRY